MKNTARIMLGSAAAALVAGFVTPGAAQADTRIPIRVDTPVAYSSYYVARSDFAGDDLTACYENRPGPAGVSDLGLDAYSGRVVSVALFTSPDCTTGIIFRTVREDPISPDGLFRFY
ncbi:hypothetical protein [Williamsia sp. CHRR-6]|uniref:hypothetical protein n=1 Tax=Williamsia sp. CHRR-6 TaxID=2835871 RepID=UPI001BDA6084|nr:hypothetical protein [Williamsia sp. CHRR-6]MBT0567705.1 hypothetical protein [Williamsia sp. CHRR-6]